MHHQTARLKAITLLVLLAGLGLAATATKLRIGIDLWSGFERDSLNPPKPPTTGPVQSDVPTEAVVIQSGSRLLNGVLVRAIGNCGPAAAVLIFHGRNETVADWAEVQKHFRAQCVTSLVFDYSGHGNSDGPGTINNLNQDAIAAYRKFMALTPGPRHCLLSHSLGGAPMLVAAGAAGNEIDCIVLASPFSSLQAMAMRGGVPALLRPLFPDEWDNVAAVAKIKAPLLWIHSRADQTIPFEEGAAVFAAALGDKQALSLEGYGHNAIYEGQPDDLWQPMLAFIRNLPVP